jgi:hypothetical protein
LKNFVLNNSKGLSILFLVIAMLMMVTISYTLSYLIPLKQKSVIFPIHSNQAFFIAQSGVEYAVRYSSEQGWRGATDSSVFDLIHLNDSGVYQRNLGNGKFTINYAAATNTLTSTGEVTSASEKRTIKVSNFTHFLRLTFDPASAGPCWDSSVKAIRFSIKNVRGDSVTLNSFKASWIQTGSAIYINQMEMDGVQKYSETYYSDNVPQSFISRQAVSPNQVINVFVYWNTNPSNLKNLILTFYTSTGDSYTFNLDPEGDGLPNC